MTDVTNCPWLGQFPHKIDLTYYPRIDSVLMEMSLDNIGPLPPISANASTVWKWKDKRIEWLYNYIGKQGENAFLEIRDNSKWVVFRGNDAETELTLFILRHS